MAAWASLQVEYREVERLLQPACLRGVFPSMQCGMLSSLAAWASLQVEYKEAEGLLPPACSPGGGLRTGGQSLLCASASTCLTPTTAARLLCHRCAWAEGGVGRLWAGGLQLWWNCSVAWLGVLS